MNGTGNPWVKLTLPVPLPVKTCTRITGTGISAGQTYITQGIPVPVPATGTHGSTTTKCVYINLKFNLKSNLKSNLMLLLLPR